MKYTIRKSEERYNKVYTIGTGHRRALTWQPAGAVYVTSVFVVATTLAALATFITPKLLILALICFVAFAFFYAVLDDANRYTSQPFKVFPYRIDKWRTAISVRYRPEFDLVETLEKTLKYPELDNFVNRDELVEEVITAIQLSQSDKIGGDEIQEYEATLESLITECEKSRVKTMLAGKDSHDSTVKAALAVAKSVNGDLQ